MVITTIKITTARKEVSLSDSDETQSKAESRLQPTGMSRNPRGTKLSHFPTMTHLGQSLYLLL